LLGKFGKGFCRVFPGFSGVGAFSGTAVMARRTGRRDHGMRGIPGRWPTAALGRRAWVRCRRDSRHARRGERERTTVARVRMVIELGGSVLKIRMIY
jgi:hypothetical protein